MDLNVVVLCGRLAAAPEVRRFDGAASLVRYLLTIRSDRPRRRIDVVPVTFWGPDEDDPDAQFSQGDELWVAGSVQRRFWESDGGRRSRIEIVAHHVELRVPDIGSAEANAF